MKTKHLFFAALLSLLSISAHAQSFAQYLSYDWAFFELKGKVKMVTIAYDVNALGESSHTVTHYFSRDGILLDEEAEELDGYFSYGYIRDEYGRIVGTGNGRSIWEWNGKKLVRCDWAAQGDESTSIYVYNQQGKRLGEKDEKGKYHKYTYITHDAKGNWTYRRNRYTTEKRKIVYY